LSCPTGFGGITFRSLIFPLIKIFFISVLRKVS
jgi:hypothetical protein